MSSLTDDAQASAPPARLGAGTVARRVRRTYARAIVNPGRAEELARVLPPLTRRADITEALTGPVTLVAVFASIAAVALVLSTFFVSEPLWAWAAFAVAVCITAALTAVWLEKAAYDARIRVQTILDDRTAFAPPLLLARFAPFGDVDAHTLWRAAADARRLAALEARTGDPDAAEEATVLEAAIAATLHPARAR